MSIVCFLHCRVQTPYQLNIYYCTGEIQHTTHRHVVKESLLFGELGIHIKSSLKTNDHDRLLLQKKIENTFCLEMGRSTIPYINNNLLI
jgi:hypothetical protein